MDWDAIYLRVRADLIVRTERGDQCILLWEHAERVARNARLILDLPEVRPTNADRAAVVVAALYYDAGWVARFKAGEVAPDEFLLHPLSDTDRELAIPLLRQSLKKLVPDESLKRAAFALQEVGNRDTDSIEAQIVAEAENLDEFGVPALWLSIRRGAFEGRGVQAVIDTWQRRKEYRFWEARLKDSFRFSTVRAVAERRLEQFERVMEQLVEQHSGDDLAQAAPARGKERSGAPIPK